MGIMDEVEQRWMGKQFTGICQYFLKKEVEGYWNIILKYK